MKLKELQSIMQDMEPFTNPKVELEQYPTGAHLASRMLYTIESMFQDFSGKSVIDLGCGTAMLAVGAALLGSPSVLGLDVDPEALEVAQANCSQFEDPLPIDFVLCDVGDLAAQRRLCADTVVMNPPFGTKRRGADVAFLHAAARLARGAIYSLHKSSTRRHVEGVALRELGCESAEVLAQLRYDLPATYAFHKQRSVDIEVDLWRFVVGRKATEAPTGAPHADRGGEGQPHREADPEAEERER